MPGLNNIVIKNFKVFNTEQIINLEGKHLLLYGENGSGKSSIYWALYTLFQGKGKGEGSRKYFLRTNNECLLNIYSEEDESSYIKISLIDEPEVYYGLDKNGISISGTSKKTEDVLESLNRNSDFITHRLLVNFYNFRNSNYINLWTVFERDILPFLKNNKNSGDKTLSQCLEDIRNQQPFRISKKGRIVNLPSNRDYEFLIERFNTDLEYWINEINLEVNKFYRKHFHSEGDEEIRINVEYKKENQLKFGFIKQLRKYKTETYIHESKDIKGLTYPIIKLSIAVLMPDGEFQEIQRPQTYLNEAKLTAIAISIRFSLLQDQIRVPYKGRILALDDLLISLDMSNRDKVLDIILNEYALEEKYVVYLFTHDKAFFNMAKKRIEHSFEKDKWLFKSVFKSNEVTKNPVFYSIDDYISLAREYINHKHDYPAAANYLRKEGERIITEFVPKKILKNDDGSNKERFNNLVLATKSFYQRIGLDTKNLNALIEFLDILLNPLSHNDIDSEVYKHEVIKTIDTLETLRTELGTLQHNIIEVDPRGTEYILTIQKDVNTFNKYLIKLKQDLFIKKSVDGSSNQFSSCQIERGIKCFEIVNERKGEEHSYNATIEQCIGFKEFYEGAANADSIPLITEYLRLFSRTKDGKTLEQIKNEH